VELMKTLYQRLGDFERATFRYNHTLDLLQMIIQQE
jgi:hypothetical protein